MNSKDAIRISIETADMLARAYLDDLTEVEMMHRPHERCNHIKWQLGHLILSDNEMINGCCSGAIPNLPSDFKSRYARDKSASDQRHDFHDKVDLIKLFEAQREAILKKLNELSEQELDAAAPDTIAEYAPTVGAAFAMLAIHATMHAGQWIVIRRQLGREPMF